MAPASQSVFVTGGSGFVGGALVRRLVAAGNEVKALARSETAAASLSALGATPVRGELSDVTAMAAGAAGCDVAYHLAAVVKQWGPREEFVRGNVDGTANALEACRRAGVRRFVHCGTEAAVLAGQPLRDADESAPLRPDSPSLYASTKARAEELVRAANGPDLDTVVVRPRFVWGAGDTTLLPGIVEAAEAGRWVWIGDGRQRTSITHVENVAHGLLLAAENGTPGSAYFVTDGEPVVFREFITELLATRGIDAPERTMAPAMAGAIARGGELAWRLLPLRGEPPLTRFLVWWASQECTLDDSKARAELGYSPVVTHERGLAELAAS